MHLHIVAVANRTADWVDRGSEHYLKRLPAPLRPRMHRLPLNRRTPGGDPARTVAEEGERILQLLPDGAHVVALDEAGSGWTTAQLSQRMQRWQQRGRDVYLLVGGPDGLSQACLERADQSWSLSQLTLPHGLVQVVLAEALYRAWSLAAGHPYHR